ncbi:hypothetical protein [Nitrosomonas sp.]|uniref:hypothetical protein n=1 Tax=Nitrosomonas sp. TaxID=42353 RepID=UPI0032EE2B02
MWLKPIALATRLAWLTLEIYRRSGGRSDFAGIRLAGAVDTVLLQQFTQFVVVRHQ